MIDLHSHLLPNLDDGSRSPERSAQVLQAFAGIGVKAVVLTPHLRASEVEEDGERHLERRRAALWDLRARAQAEPELHLGFEILLDEPMPVLAIGDRRYALAGSRYYLVEFRLSVVAEFTTPVLEQFTRSGLIPLVAHPERYRNVGPETVAAWRRSGARTQLDATTLTRSTSRGRRARRLLAHGLADVVAADNHGDDRSLATARNYLTELGYADAARTLTETNPGAVVENGEMTETGTVEIREGMLGRIKNFLSG